MELNSRKLRILNKLAAAGADTEKKITALGFPEIIHITRQQKLAMSDMELILELQTAIRNRRVIGYLTDGEDKEEESKHEKKDQRNETESAAVSGPGRREHLDGAGDGDRRLSGPEGIRGIDARRDDRQY